MYNNYTQVLIKVLTSVTHLQIFEETSLVIVAIQLLILYLALIGMQTYEPIVYIHAHSDNDNILKMYTVFFYICCTFSDVQCGQLHCMQGDFMLNIAVTILTFTIGADVCR